MKYLLLVLIAITFLSCIGKEKPFLHDKTVPFTCDNKFFVRLLNTDIRKEHIVPSDDGKSFYTITENGIFQYNIDNLQKKGEKSIYFGNNLSNYFFVRPDKKIWIVAYGEPGDTNGSSYATYYLIDTTGNIYLTKKARGGIISDNNNGFVLAGNEYDSAEWVNYHTYKGLDKYFVESYDENGNFLWGKNYDLKGGEIESLCYLSTNEILIGGYIDSYNSGKAYLVKLNAKGILQWSKTYVSDYNSQNYSVKDILEKSDQSYSIIISRVSYSLNLLETDSAGLPKWNLELSGYFSGTNHLVYTNDQYFVLHTYQGDIKITCLNNSGAVLWSHNYGGTGIESPVSIDVLPSYDIFVTGTTENWDGVHYDPSFSDYFIRTDKDGNTCY